MDLVNHRLRIWKRLAHKLHSVPQIVVSPILPVLNHTVYRYSILTITMKHIKQFLLTFISLTALHKSIRPQWQHWYIARKFTNARHHSNGITSIYKIIVYGIAHFRRESNFSAFIRNICRRIIIPIYSVSFFRLEEQHTVLCISRSQLSVYSPL